MQYIEFKKKLREYVVFSLSDIKKIDKDFYHSRLNEWQKKDYIKKIRRGYYMFADQNVDESVLFYIANKIYAPSYVSFEMALSYYDLIPESAYAITSASTNKTSRFKTASGEFIYHRLKPELMFGYDLISAGGAPFKIAEAERAVLDFFYINANLKTEDDFFELRVNKDEFGNKIDGKKLKKYLLAFQNKSMEARIKKFLKYIRYAFN